METLVSKRPPQGLFDMVTNLWTRPFWEAAAQQRLVAPRCGACGAFRMPPTPFCPACRSQAVDWVRLSGRGRIFSYTVVSRAIFAGMEQALPYVPAVIELDGAQALDRDLHLVGRGRGHCHIFNLEDAGVAIFVDPNDAAHIPFLDY